MGDNYKYSKRSPNIYVLLSVIMLFHICLFCNICEENNPCFFSYKWTISQDVNVQFVWRINGEDTGSCMRLNGKIMCVTFQKFMNSMKQAVKAQSDDSVVASVNLFNVDRKSEVLSESTWELLAFYENKSSIQLYTCQLKIYSAISEIKCDHKASAFGLKVDCIASKSYPESSCNLQIKRNKQAINSLSEISFNHTSVEGDPVYFSTVCSIVIPNKSLFSGIYEIEAVMYPKYFDASNYTGEKRFKKTILMEYPRASVTGCPEFVKDGENIDCVCTRNDASEIESEVLWYFNNTVSEESKTVAALKTKAYKNITDYTCISRNSLGWTTIVKYTPNFIGPTTLYFVESSFERDSIASTNRIAKAVLSLTIIILVCIAIRATYSYFKPKWRRIKRKKDKNTTHCDKRRDTLDNTHMLNRSRQIVMIQTTSDL